jgi:hypothetical protein
MTSTQRESLRGAAALCRLCTGFPWFLAALLAATSAAAEIEPPEPAPFAEPISEQASPAPDWDWSRRGLHFAAGAAGAALAVPLSLAMCTGIGEGSNNLLLSAVPALLLYLAIPPIAVAASTTYGEAWLFDTPVDWVRPALWTTLIVHAGIVFGAMAMGVSTHDLGRVAPFTLAEVLLLPATATLSDELWAPAPVQPAAIPASQDPREPVAHVVPLLSASF